MKRKKRHAAYLIIDFPQIWTVFMDSAGYRIQFWRVRTIKKKFDAAFESKVPLEVPQGFPKPAIGADFGQ